MSGFDWAAIAESEEQARRRLLLLQAFERIRQRSKEVQAEEDARTEEADPFAASARLFDASYYQDQYALEPTTAAEKAEQLLFDALSSGGAQASISPTSALGSALFDQLGTLLSAYDRTEPS